MNASGGEDESITDYPVQDPGRFGAAFAVCIYTVLPPLGLAPGGRPGRLTDAKPFSDSGSFAHSGTDSRPGADGVPDADSRSYAHLFSNPFADAGELCDLLGGGLHACQLP